MYRSQRFGRTLRPPAQSPVERVEAEVLEAGIGQHRARIGGRQAGGKALDEEAMGDPALKIGEPGRFLVCGGRNCRRGNRRNADVRDGPCGYCLDVLRSAARQAAPERVLGDLLLAAGNRLP